MKAVIFDRDGVLIDSEEIHVLSVVETFRELGISITKEEKEYILGRHTDDYLGYFLEKYNFPREKFRKRARLIYFSRLKTAKIFHKTVSLMKRLHRLKIPLAVNGSGSRRTTLSVLDMIGIKKCFDVVVGGDECRHRKPDPESYLLTAKRLGVAPEDCVVIEDSTVGLAAAKAAGMKCIIIPNQTTKGQDFSQADLVVDSADKIDIELLKKM